MSERKWWQTDANFLLRMFCVAIVGCGAFASVVGVFVLCLMAVLWAVAATEQERLFHDMADLARRGTEGWYNTIRDWYRDRANYAGAGVPRGQN